jgi:VIT1/CCC1 family predicted Fe2+/Mn2+ transporter
MSERTAERTRETDSDDETSEDGALGGVETATTTAADTTESSDSGGTIFSVGALVVAFVAIGAGMIAGSLVPVIPFTALAGIPVGAFLHGLLDSQRRYIETAIAGGVSAGAAVVTSLLPQMLAGLDGTRLFAIAAAVGLVLAVVGHYFGRDLRDGLTRDL